MTLDEKTKEMEYPKNYDSFPVNVDVTVICLTEDEKIVEIHCLNLTKNLASAFANGSNVVHIARGTNDSIIASYKKRKDETTQYIEVKYKERRLSYEKLPQTR